MDENDLRTLDREPLRPGGRPRPVDDVLGRGRRLRRRATAARALPVVVAASLLIAGAGVLAGNGTTGDGDADVSTSPDASTVPQPGPGYCPQEPQVLTSEEAPGELLLVPDSGGTTGSTQLNRYDADGCTSVDPALVLRAVDGAVIEAEITLAGPYGEPYRAPESATPTELAGRQASRASTWSESDSHVAFTWTEPDGRSWLLTGVGAGADEQTVRALAERLDLDNAPADGEPAADLPSAAVPPEFERVWRAPGLPAVEHGPWLEWVVMPGQGSSEDCSVSVRTTALEAPPGSMASAAAPDGQAEQVEVRGATGLAAAEAMSATVQWREAPGVVGSATCPGGIEAVVQFAESLVLQEPDAQDP
jgi:hypothetical protein